MSEGESVLIAVRVLPNASRTACQGRNDEGVYKIRLQARPEKGKANKALIHYLARHLGIGRGAIAFVSGETARHKRLRIRGLSEEEIRSRLLSGCA